MRYAMSEEIMATIIADRGEEYYESWIKKPIEEREKVGLVVSYDMGWQKRASGNLYSSKSGHAFVVGMQTRRILTVLYSVQIAKGVSTSQKRRRYQKRMKRKMKS